MLEGAKLIGAGAATIALAGAAIGIFICLMDETPKRKEKMGDRFKLQNDASGSGSNSNKKKKKAEEEPPKKTSPGIKVNGGILMPEELKNIAYMLEEISINTNILDKGVHFTRWLNFLKKQFPPETHTSENYFNLLDIHSSLKKERDASKYFKIFLDKLCQK